MPTRVDTPRSGQVLYGVNSDQFKVNLSAHVRRHNNRGNVIHLAKAKPDMTTIFALFSAIVSGIKLEAEEFKYVSEDDMLTITNVSGVVGIIASGGPEIPLYPAVDDSIALSDIHILPDLS